MLSLTRQRADEREDILFHENYAPKKYLGGVRHFDGISMDKVQTLIDKGYLMESERQNGSPTVKEFLDFVDKTDTYKPWLFSGYAVSINRDDCRVTLDGIECDESLSEKDLILFFNMARSASELTIEEGYVRAWWD